MITHTHVSGATFTATFVIEVPPVPSQVPARPNANQLQRMVDGIHSRFTHRPEEIPIVSPDPYGFNESDDFTIQDHPIERWFR